MPNTSDDGTYAETETKIKSKAIKRSATTSSTSYYKPKQSNNSTPNGPRPPAIIYKLFDKLIDKGQCKICGKILSALQGSTSTLRRHAARFHPEEWAEIHEEANMELPHNPNHPTLPSGKI